MTVHWIATEVITLAEHFSSTLAMKVLFFEQIASPENKSREKNKWSKSYVIFVASRFFLPKTCFYCLFFFEWDDFWLFDGLQGWNPVFDRGPLESFYYNTGLPFDWASSFNALIVFGEHRWPFFGWREGARGVDNVGSFGWWQWVPELNFLLEHYLA